MDLHEEQRLELIRQGRQMRLVRWLAVPFTLAQFTLYKPPNGVRVPFDGALIGSLVASIVVLINLVSIAGERSKDVRTLGWIARLELAADCAIGLGVVWLFTFDRGSALWAILILPVLEGAIRYKLGGALVTWAGLATGYIAREIAAPRLIDGAELKIESITYRLGLLLIVAAATGFLARNLEDRIVSHREAREEADHRADLLRVVARASRVMSTLDTDRVLSIVVDASAEIGFEACTIVVLDPETGTYSQMKHRGLPDNFTKLQRDSSQGVIGLVTEQGKTVVIDDYEQWEGSVPDARHLGFHSVVACPIWLSGDLSSVLVVGRREANSVSPTEVEVLELLTAHAGAALTTARHFSERQQLAAQLRHEAFHDSLTGLPNRTLFLDRLDHCLERKANAPTPTAVLFIDLDHFKKVNDSFGSEAGDEVLLLVSERLQVLRDPGDTVARYGGDQFAVLVEEPESQRSVLKQANRIVKSVQEPFLIEGGEVYISASIGVSFRYQAEGHARDFLREADLAMHRAKEQGGERCEAYRPVMWTRAKHRMEMELELRRALERDEFRVHYQPAVSLQSGNVVGLEALVRWDHPDRGLITASEFIPLAEETGLIIRIGQRILDEVAAQVSVWRSTGTVPPIPVGVNLSATEFTQPDFVERVISVVDGHKLHPEQIMFEVTESVVMRDDAVTLAQMRKLERIGIRLAIDDFGLGYSSLNYLKRFRFSVLKIDKSFVADVATRETDQAIVRYVLGLAGDLKIPVVAEGVETSDQLDYLKGLGCQYVQGFLICKPLDAGQLAEFVRAGEDHTKEQDRFDAADTTTLAG